MQRDEALQVLVDTLGQELLHSAIPVRLTYTGTDGITPEWAKLLDFQTRVPDVLSRLAEEQARDGE